MGIKNLKRDYEEIVRRNQAFVKREKVDRPLLGIWIGEYVPLKIYQGFSEVFANFKNSSLRPENIEPGDFLEEIDRNFFEHEEVGDDLFYSAVPLIGFPWLEAIVGCPIFVSSEAFWAKPFLTTFEEGIYFLRESLTKVLSNPWFQKLIEFRKLLARHAEGRYPLATTFCPMRGPGDIMGAMFGQERLCLESYDHPEEAKMISDIITDIWLQVAKAQIENTPPFWGGYTVAFYNIWTPGICQYMQEDALAYLSPKIYKEILWDNHVRMSKNSEYSLIHLHPDSLYCLEEICNIESLKIVEIGRDLSGPTVFDLMHMFKYVQEKGKALLIWGELTKEEIKEVLAYLSPKGLCVCPVVNNVEEGQELVMKMKEWVNEE